MARDAALYSLVIALSLLSGLVAYAVALLKRGSAATPARKSRSAPGPTENSLQDSHAELQRTVAQLQADQAALFSTLESVTTTVKRLSSRAGMKALREERMTSTPEPPGPNASKAEKLAYYGLTGAVGPAFARRQQELELETNRERAN